MQADQILELAKSESQHFCRALSSVLVAVASHEKIVLPEDLEQEFAVLTGQVATIEAKIAKAFDKAISNM